MEIKTALKRLKNGIVDGGTEDQDDKEFITMAKYKKKDCWSSPVQSLPEIER